MEPVSPAPAFIWMTNIDTSEPVGIRVDQILLVEQKRPENGGAVAIYLAHGKEIQVIESFQAVRDMIVATTPREAAAPTIGAAA